MDELILQRIRNNVNRLVATIEIAEVRHALSSMLHMMLDQEQRISKLEHELENKNEPKPIRDIRDPA